MEIEITPHEIPVQSKNVTCAIVVPFNAPANGKVEVATITESQILVISNDVTGLLVDGKRDKYKITFIVSLSPAPIIFIADEELSLPDNYLMEAEPSQWLIAPSVHPNRKCRFL